MREENVYERGESAFKCLFMCVRERVDLVLHGVNFTNILRSPH